MSASVRAGATISAEVLVVEDEQIVALELKDRLTRMGHSVVGIVASAEEAIEESRRLHPDLILMDIKLQGELDGIDAAAAIRKEFDSATIYITAFADETTLQRAKLTQPYGYILKPFTSASSTWSSRSRCTATAPNARCARALIASASSRSRAASLARPSTARSS